MTKKTLTRLAAACLILAVAAGGGLYFAAKRLLEPEQLRTRAQTMLAEALHREVSIKTASFGLLKGVSLSELRVADKDDPGALFVSAERIDVRPRWWPLLRGRVEVGSVSLVRPFVRLSRKADGALNIADLTSSGAPAATGDQPSSARSLAWTVRRTEVGDGTVVWNDETGGPSGRIEKLNVSLRGLSLVDPFSAAGSFDAFAFVRDSTQSARVEFDAGLDILRRAVTLEELSLASGEASVGVKGSVDLTEKKTVDAAIAIKNASADLLRPWTDLPESLDGTAVSLDVAAEGPLASPALSGSGSINGPGLTADFDLTGTVHALDPAPAFDVDVNARKILLDDSPFAPDVRFAAPLSGTISAAGSASAVNAEWELSSAHPASWGRTDAKSAGSFATNGRAAWSANAPLRFSGALIAKNLGIAPDAPLAKGLSLDGRVDVDASAEGTLDALAFKMRSDLAGLRIAYADKFAKTAQTTMALAAEGRLTGMKDAAISAGTLSLAASRIRFSGTISDVAGGMLSNLSVAPAPADLAEAAALVPLLRAYKPSGRATGNASVKGPLVDPDVSGRLQLAGVSAVPMDGFAMSSVSGPLRFSLNDAETSGLSGKLNNATFTAAGFVKDFERMDVRLDADLAELDAEAFLKIFADEPVPVKSSRRTGNQPTIAAVQSPPPGGAMIAKTQGTVRVGRIFHPNYEGRRFRFEWNLTEIGSDMSRANGTANVRAADGVIRNLPLAAKINKILKENKADLTYESLSSDFKIVDGVLATDNFTVDSSKTDLFAKGTVRLNDLASDMTLTARLPAGSVGGSLGEWFSDDQGRPTLKAKLKGVLSDPEVTVDISDAVRKAGDELLKKGQEALDRFFRNR